MSSFRVLPLPSAIAEAVRTTGTSPQYGHPAYLEVARGTGPCRLCLSTFAVGSEERLLFTYNPFDGLDPYPLPGPVFIHAAACTPHAGAGFPSGLRTLPLVFEAYGLGREPRGRALAHGDEIEGAIHRLLGDAGVAYLHVRHGEAGCYIARIERAAARSTLDAS